MSSNRNFRLGLIGRDVSYSLSPPIHRWALAATGLRGEYMIHDVDVEGARKLVQSDEWDGLNVTIPFKTQVVEFCDSLTEVSRLASSVNTLFHRKGQVVGDTTDGIGFLFALSQLSTTIGALEEVLVIGSGGAARAIVLELRKSRIVSRVFIASRQPARAEEDFSELRSGDFLVNVKSLSETAHAMNRFDLIVQATPVGSASQPGLPLPPPFQFKRGARVMDLIYAPRRTDFLRIAEEQGAHVQNGLPMLIGQAAASFEIWTGAVFPRERALNELMPELESL